jgi:hypothetical protein
MVADLLGELEDRYGTDAQVLDALIAVEVLPRDPPDDPDGAGSIVEHRATSPRITIAVGLARATLESLLEGYERGDGEEPD